MKIFPNPISVFATLSLFGHSAKAALSDSLTYEWNDVSLPFPLSDMMANTMVVDDKELIVITGGCDDPNGNQRNETEALDLFFCLSVTAKTLTFDPVENKFTRVKDSPMGRYRHAATEHNGELYLIGGRDEQDNLIREIVVSVSK